MAVHKTKNGRWKAKVNYRNSDGVIKTKEKTFDKKSDASNFDREYRQSVNKEVDEGITYQEIFEHSILVSSSKVLPRSIQDKRTNANTYWSNLFERKYASISKKDYLDVWVKITATNKSYATKNKAIKYLKSVSKFAYNYYDFKDNAKHLELLSATSDDITEIVTWTQKEFDTFINYVDDKIYKALFILYYDTGVTLSEALAIRKVEYSGDQIEINDLLESKDKRRRLKNRFRKRKVMLATKTRLVTDELMSLEGEYLFGGIEPLSNRTVPRKLEFYIKRANSRMEAKGLPKLARITIHGFRHSHATNLINNGANIVAVSRRLGHSNIQTTLRTYTHLLDQGNNEIINLIDEL